MSPYSFHLETRVKIDSLLLDAKRIPYKRGQAEALGVSL